MMFNGELIREATSIESGSWLDQIARANTKLPEKVNFLFIAGMGRKATKDELIAAEQLLVLATARRSKCCRICGGRF